MSMRRHDTYTGMTEEQITAYRESKKEAMRELRKKRSQDPEYKEQRRIWNKKYYESHREELAKKRKAAEQADPERFRQYRIHAMQNIAEKYLAEKAAASLA